MAENREMLFTFQIERAATLMGRDLGVGEKIDDPRDEPLNDRETRQRRLGRLESLRWVLGEENEMTRDAGRLMMDETTGARYMRERTGVLPDRPADVPGEHPARPWIYD